MATGDVTNQTEPTAGGKLSGETYRAAAIKRLKKLQEAGSYNMLPKGK